MKKNYYIITGTSRGIGEALARKVLTEGHSLISISRNQNPKLQVEAFVKKFDYVDVNFDLCQVHKIPEMMHLVMRKINPEVVNKIFLVNNAGTINPVKAIGNNKVSGQISRNVNVNLLAPMLISEHFIRETDDWNVDRRIMNVGSGAASRAVFGWSSYCSSKAGMEMFTRCLAEEQKDVENPVKIVSFSPGVVDTEMQSEVRAADAEDFPELEKFVNYKVEGELLDPAHVAVEMFNLLNSTDFGLETLIRIKS